MCNSFVMSWKLGKYLGITGKLAFSRDSQTPPPHGSRRSDIHQTGLVCLNIGWPSRLRRLIMIHHNFPILGCTPFSDNPISGFPEMGVPQNGWFLRENPSKMDDIGVLPFSHNPIYTRSCVFFWRVWGRDCDVAEVLNGQWMGNRYIEVADVLFWVVD